MARTELRNRVQSFGLCFPRREYIVVNVPYGKARHIFVPEPYSALSGKGEQRGIVPAHSRKLRKEIEEGTFTPTAVAVGLRPRHQQAVVYGEQEGKRTALVVVEEKDTLPLTDGGHRLDALKCIREEAERDLQHAKTDEQKAAARARIDLVDDQPITAIVLLNGDTQEDFVNLQQGKPVDPAHMLSLRVGRQATPPALKLAYEAAKLLNGADGSDFRKMVKFDSTSLAPYPVSTLCSKGSSDLGTSLVGLAKVGLASDEPKDAAWLASCVVAACQAVKAKAPDLMGEGRVLTPPPDGTRGAATLLIGLGVALAYRMQVVGEDKPSEKTLAYLVDAARQVLDRTVSGNFAGPVKRQLLGLFVREFFADLTTLDKHEGIPVGLIKALSASAFGVPALPKPPKAGQAVVPSPSLQEAEGDWARASAEFDEGPLPDVDGAVAEEAKAQAGPEQSEDDPWAKASPEWEDDEPAPPKETYGALAMDGDACNGDWIRYAADDCILFLMRPQEHLDEAFARLREWGFSYRGCKTVVESSSHRRHRLSGRVKHCLVAVRGQPQFDLNGWPDVAQVPAGELEKRVSRFIKQACPAPGAAFGLLRPPTGWERPARSQAQGTRAVA